MILRDRQARLDARERRCARVIGTTVAIRPQSSFYLPHNFFRVRYADKHLLFRRHCVVVFAKAMTEPRRRENKSRANPLHEIPKCGTKGNGGHNPMARSCAGLVKAEHIRIGFKSDPVQFSSNNPEISRRNDTTRLPIGDGGGCYAHDFGGFCGAPEGVDYGVDRSKHTPIYFKLREAVKPS